MTRTTAVERVTLAILFLAATFAILATMLFSSVSPIQGAGASPHHWKAPSSQQASPHHWKAPAPHHW